MKKIIGGIGGAVFAGLTVLLVGMQVRAEPTRATMPDIDKLVHYTTVTRGEPIPNGTHVALVDYRDGKVFRYFFMEKGENWGQEAVRQPRARRRGRGYSIDRIT